jgi:hypothetical protein
MDSEQQPPAASSLLDNIDLKPQEDPNAIMKPLQIVFAQDRDSFPKKCYYYDGNPDMYTKKA